MDTVNQAYRQAEKTEVPEEVKACLSSPLSCLVEKTEVPEEVKTCLSSPLSCLPIGSTVVAAIDKIPLHKTRVVQTCIAITVAVGVVLLVGHITYGVCRNKDKIVKIGSKVVTKGGEVVDCLLDDDTDDEE